MSETGSTPHAHAHKPESAGDAKLRSMGVMTAVAIGLHNFPEGLATFVATLDDPAVGGALAIAIAIHNIPEGLCVSIPIYFATGDRWKAFRWALLSGASEPVGAALGWVLLKNHFNETVYGVIFGMVAGMMIMICMHELIPTAHRYDPMDQYVTKAIVGGMLIMAASLCLFVYG
ncbi:Zinc/iron permease [Pelagophyceae sp. CCMP2097]|nr:Zinc/iron permease [Pelagophyceae sp. CCMP2097]